MYDYRMWFMPPKYVHIIINNTYPMARECLGSFFGVAELQSPSSMTDFYGRFMGKQMYPGVYGVVQLLICRNK